MDVLRKELNEFYASQQLQDEILDYSLLKQSEDTVRTIVEQENDCRVITDASADFCYIFGGSCAYIIGLSEEQSFAKEMDSSDEDIIYIRLHPEDLVDKRMLEYDFFKYIDTLPSDNKLDYAATCRLRILSRSGRYVYVDNSTRILRLSPSGKVWLILCKYSLSPDQDPREGILPRIINFTTGDMILPQLAERRDRILTSREKEILNLIRDGKPSKQIADILNISLHTVNRHRQNILRKLSVGNSVEAVIAAQAMRLL